MREEKLLGLRADLQVGGSGFGKFSEVSTIFSAIFWKISTIFLEFSAIFWKIFLKIFAIFFNFCDFPTIFPENFSENSCPQSVTVQPGSRHYCKFTSKFTSRITPKFTLILIKILQSTKFEGSHFFNSLSTFITFHNLSQLLSSLSSLCALCPSPPCFLDRSSAVPKAPTAVPPLATSEVCGQYEGL